MKKKDIEARIYEEFNESKPELFQKILEQCPKMTESRKESFISKMGSFFSKRRFKYSFASAIMIVVIVFSIVMFNPNLNRAPYSVIAIDVNPSIVLELDKDDKVIQVIKENEDAIIIIGSMDLIGVDSDVAINALIGSMVTKGYISEISNSVLLSVQSNDSAKQQQMLTTFTQTISDFLSGSSINGSVMSQTLDLSDDAEVLAELLDISEAKAELILHIVQIDPRMTVEDLSKLSINDLNLLLESKNYNLDTVKHTGKASEMEIIPAGEIYQTALDYFDITVDQVLEYEIELEQEDGFMVYEIDIDTENFEYSIIINAKEGTVYESQQEDKGSDDSDDFSDIDQENILSVSEIMSLIAEQLDLTLSIVTELETDLEQDNGIIFYDVSFDYGDFEYELEIDASTGIIYSNSQDEEGYDSYEEEDESDSE